MTVQKLYTPPKDQTIFPLDRLKFRLQNVDILIKEKTMYNFEYFAELDSYEAQAEYEAWLDEQEDFMVRCHEQEMSPEVVE